MLIQVLTFLVLQYSRKKDREHVHIMIVKDITKTLIMVCSSSWRLQETAIEIYLYLFCF